LAVGSWQLAVGSWQLAVGSWQLAVGSWQLAVILKNYCCFENVLGFKLITDNCQLMTNLHGPIKEPWPTAEGTARANACHITQ